VTEINKQMPGTGIGRQGGASGRIAAGGGNSATILQRLQSVDWPFASLQMLD